MATQNQVLRPFKTMFRLMAFMKPFSLRLWLSVVASIMNKVLDLMPPLLVAWVIDTVSGNPPSWIVSLSRTWGRSDAWSLAVILSILAFLIFIFESVFQWGFNYGFMTLSQKVQHALRLSAYHQLQTREMAFFEDHRLGNTLSILNDDVNQLERFLNTAFNELIQVTVVVIFATVVMINTSLQLAMFALLPVPIVIIGSLFYQRRISPRYAKIREQVGRLLSRLENNIAGILVVKSFGAEAFEYERVEKSSERYLLSQFHAIRLMSVYVPLIRTAIAIGFSGVLLLGSYWILNGYAYITVGELVFFSMMIQRLLWPLTRMGAVLDEYERANASAKRIFSIIDTPSSIQSPESPVANPPREGAIVFDRVHFHYSNQLPVLTDLSFRIEAGETVGIAGITGSGKSTIIKSLLRLYDVTKGDILVDGVSVKDYRLSDLRHAVALVSQDVYLFHGTIFENIAYGKSGCCTEEVVNAAKQAHLHSFIESLPLGYESIVGERGIKLSGGQRQRLSIARAILKNAPIMVFDEATSSVDTETERAIQKNIDDLTKGKTALVIAHRLSTIRYADRILVLEKGSLAEEGTHDTLLDRGGLYKDLWDIQIGRRYDHVGSE